MKKRILLFILLVLSLGLGNILAQNDLDENPDEYFGEVVTVEGVVDIVSPNAFVLSQTEPFDLSPDSLLTFPATDGSFGIDINNGQRVRVTGVFNQYDLVAMEAAIQMDLDDNALAQFSPDDYTLTASAVEILETTGRMRLMDSVAVGEFMADPTTYFDETVTVEGVVDIVSPNVFVLNQTEPFDLAPESVLIFPGADNEFGIDINNGARVRVQGTFNAYDLPALEASVGFDYDDSAFGAYDSSDYALVADNVTLLSEANYLAAAASLNSLVSAPDDYIGETLTVAGYIGRDVDLETGNFILFDDATFGTERVLVLSEDTASIMGSDSMTMGLTEGDRVVVTGDVQEFNLVDLESEVGYELSDTLYVPHQGLPVIVASSVEQGAESDVMNQNMQGADTNGATTTFDASNYADYPEADTDLGDVIGDPAAYYGQIVNVSGDIPEFIDGDRAFYISDEDFLSPDYALVLVPDEELQEIIALLTQDDPVTVRGVVRPFNFVDLENEIGFEMDDAAYGNVDGTAVIIALEIIPNVE
ncbi:MAG: hypothetical protein RLP44_28310 [Aggregatilineales bacterium]